MRQAGFKQGTGRTAPVVVGGRRDALRKQFLHRGADGHGLGAERVVEVDRGAVLFFAEKQRSLGDFGGEHLFETHRLGAELDLVAARVLGRAAFVFDRKRQPRAIEARNLYSALGRRTAVQLDHIRNTGEPEAKRPEPKASENLQVAPRLVRAAVGLFMKHISFGSEHIVSPCLFKYFEAAPSGAVDVLADRG